MSQIVAPSSRGIDPWAPFRALHLSNSLLEFQLSSPTELVPPPLTLELVNSFFVRLVVAGLLSLFLLTRAVKRGKRKEMGGGGGMEKTMEAESETREAKFCLYAFYECECLLVVVQTEPNSR